MRGAARKGGPYRKRPSSAGPAGAGSEPVYNRLHGKWQVAERQSEGAVVAIDGRDNITRPERGTLLHRRMRRSRGALMSAEHRLGPSGRPMAWARSCSSTRALSQRQARPSTAVPRPLRQARPQRCDVEGMADVATDAGAPGVDGVTIEPSKPTGQPG